ncbi:hypothetical protein [Flavobacterium notoginsengisoli]|uniref:hypothetical protein n=1 Tax=Flavobacterium notoginsengisoli TaxID=1478199 RepID=UPI003645335C
MNTTDKTNRTFPKDPGSPISDRNTVMNEELYDLNTRETQSSRAEDAERGYTVRDGYNPNKPNPDQNGLGYEEDLDDLNDDFHTDRDLEDNNDDIYEIVLEEEDDFDDEEEDDFDDEEEDEYIEEDLDEEIENDEFDNPADTFENDFNETEEDLEDIDDEEEIEDEDDNDYIEDDVQEDNDNEEYPENDPRRF